MSSANNPYQTFGLSVAQSSVDERSAFIRRTYAHLAGAVLAFAALETVLLNLPGIDGLLVKMLAGRLGWLVVMIAFVAVGSVARNWARSGATPARQYAGLGLYVVLEAFIFLPLLYVASHFGGDGVIATAGILTGTIFGGLTGIVFFTKADFSFLRTALWIGGLAGIGLIVASMLFGFSLGIWAVALFIVLACGYIAYDTSNIIHHYGVDQHVAASLELFASVALLFWYVLQFVMQMSRRD